MVSDWLGYVADRTDSGAGSQGQGEGTGGDDLQQRGQAGESTERAEGNGGDTEEKIIGWLRGRIGQTLHNGLHH